MTLELFRAFIYYLFCLTAEVSDSEINHCKSLTRADCDAWFFFLQLKFLEVCQLSFVTQLGDKWKEGMVMKRSGGHKFKMGFMKDIKGCVGGCHCCRMWQQR